MQSGSSTSWFKRYGWNRAFEHWSDRRGRKTRRFCFIPSIKIIFYNFSANNYIVSKRFTYLGRAALAQLVKKKLASYLRDVTPKQMDRELRAFSRAARILSSDHPRLIDSHPKQWVGIHNGSVCATGKSFSSLISQLKKRGLSPNDTIIRYIDTSGRKLIL
jgi:hypothetical protein